MAEKMYLSKHAGYQIRITEPIYEWVGNSKIIRDEGMMIAFIAGKYKTDDEKIQRLLEASPYFKAHFFLVGEQPKLIDPTIPVTQGTLGIANSGLKTAEPVQEKTYKDTGATANQQIASAHKKECAYCKKLFTATSHLQKYCSPICREDNAKMTGQIEENIPDKDV